MNCVVTLALVVFLPPAGLADGIRSAPALVLIPRGEFGDRPFTPRL